MTLVLQVVAVVLALIYVMQVIYDLHELSGNTPVWTKNRSDRATNVAICALTAVVLVLLAIWRVF